MIDLSKYRFRSSQIGRLIPKRLPKTYSLNKTAQSYLNEIIQEEIFGRSHEIKSKYLEKGIAVEEDSFNLYCKVTNMLLFKNNQRFNNLWMSGEPDNWEGKVRDIKSSWDFSTFPMLEESIPNELYKWQLLSYMELTGLREAELIYCLVDTPFNLIDDELKRLSWKLGYKDLQMMPEELRVETVTNLLYTEKGITEYCNQSLDVDIEMFQDFKPIEGHIRVKVFEYEWNQEDVDVMYAHLELAREYLIDSVIKLAA